MRPWIVVAGTMWLVVAGLPQRPETALRCTADANLSSYEGETVLNYGASTRIRLKGIQMLGVFRFDTGPIAGLLVEDARLRLRYAGNDRRLRALGFSTVGTGWNEGDGRGDRIAGAMCFAAAELGRRRWAAPDSDFTDAAFVPGESLTAYSEVTDEGDGWISAPVAPDIVQACVAGLAQGIAVTDEKGQTMANNDVFSREQSGSEPVLLVRTRSGAPGPPAPGIATAAGDAEGATFTGGALRVDVRLPAGSLGYEAAVTYGAPGRTRMLRSLAGLRTGAVTRLIVRELPASRVVEVALRSIGPTGARSRPITTRAMTSAALPRPRLISSTVPPGMQRPCPNFRAGDATVTVRPGLVRSDLNGTAGSVAIERVWNGSAIQLQACQGERVSLSLQVAGAGADLPNLRVNVASGFPSAVYALLATGTRRPLADLCTPQAPRSGAPSRTDSRSASRQYLVEFNVPPTARQGTHIAQVTVACGDRSPANVPIELRVADQRIPIRPSFEVSLNTYGSPARADGRDPAAQAGIESERAYHRLAYDHRATLTPLGYSHAGTIEPGYAPPLTGSGRGRKVADWSGWDARFGPYLDGSAFRAGLGAGQPISHLYLPFHEAWPEDIRAHYAYRSPTTAYPDCIVQHAMLAGPIERLMSDEYRDGLEAVVRQFADHIRNRGWTRTTFHFYLNNKHYYRDPAQGGRGTSWWLLDEPMNRDDWLALAYFGRALKAGLGANGRRRAIAFRADISRPQWQRGYLDGIEDLMVVNEELMARPTLMRSLKRRLGVTLWHYGEAPAPDRPLRDFTGWPIRAYLAGADGIVPWQTIGGRENLQVPSPTGLIVASEPTRPLATLRLKAIERGQEDVELLALLGRKRGWSREQLAHAVSGYTVAARWDEMRDAIHAELARTVRRRIQASQRPGHADTGPARRARPNP